MSRAWTPWVISAGLLVRSPAVLAERVAVVVGISEYPALPADVQPTQARKEAEDLARYLEQDGGYRAVHTLMDGVATLRAIRRLLLETVPPTLQPGDTLLIAFMGDGIGADSGDPYLLLYDSRVDDPQNTALRLRDFAPELSRKLDGVNLVIVTDAAHPGAANGVPMMGPSAESWPTLPGNVFLLSAASPGETAPDGIFGPLLVAGLAGAADADGDGRVTAGEIYRYLRTEEARKTHDAVHPAQRGTYDPSLVLSDASPGAPGSRRGWRGAVAYGLTAGGATVLGFGVVSYFDARHRYCTAADGGFACPNTPGYTTARNRQTIAWAAGAALLTAGIVTGFAPRGKHTVELGMGSVGFVWSFGPGRGQ